MANVKEVVDEVCVTGVHFPVIATDRRPGDLAYCRFIKAQARTLPGTTAR
jgi:UDP-glucose 4-epimerase